MTELRKMGPLPATHPAVGVEICPMCERTFAAGDLVTLVPTWVRERGRDHPPETSRTVACDIYHWDCVADESGRLATK